MSVKRSKVSVRHPDSGLLSVKAGLLEVDLSQGATAEDCAAVVTIIKAASDEGRAAFKKEAREKTAELAERDLRRQAGTRKERRPEITDWIRSALGRDPNATREKLWGDAPQWLIEQIGLDRFKKRVSAVRRNKIVAGRK